MSSSSSSSSSSFVELIRYRDIVACMGFVLLVKFSWMPPVPVDYGVRIPSAFVHLDFYSNTSSLVCNPVVLDMNGDDQMDVILLPQTHSIQILPFPQQSPSSSSSSSSLLTYLPALSVPILYSIENDVPLVIQSHYHPALLWSNNQNTDNKNSKKEEDASLYYYCGMDWMDANSHCYEACPDGHTCTNTSHSCFADIHVCHTNQNARKKEEEEQQQQQPCVTMFYKHSGKFTLTCYSPSLHQWKVHWQTTLLSNNKKKQQQQHWMDVDWKVSLDTSSIYIAITYRDDDDESGHHHHGHHSSQHKTIYQSIHYYTGAAHWSHDYHPTNNNNNTTVKDAPPVTTTTTTTTPIKENPVLLGQRRRQSMVVGLTTNKHDDNNDNDNERSSSCWHHYRSWIIQTALPHLYHWNPHHKSQQQQQQHRILSNHHGTIHIQPFHHHRRRHHPLPSKSQSLQQQLPSSSVSTKKKKVPTKQQIMTRAFFWKHVLERFHPEETTKKHHHRHDNNNNNNRNNNNHHQVLVFHNRDGIHVRSLKNGQPICHVSLSPHHLFMDLNQDGSMDQIQVHFPTTIHNDQEEEEENDNAILHNLYPNNHHNHNNNQKGIHKGSMQPCSVVVTSGVLKQEILFRQDTLCHGKMYPNRFEQHEYRPPPSSSHVVLQRQVAAPIVLYDQIVFALNNGRMVSYNRYDGTVQWILSNLYNTKQNSPFQLPTWSSSHVATLNLIDFPISLHKNKQNNNINNPIMASSLDDTKVRNIRPILVSGEDRLALVSSSDGTIYSSIKFPQSSIRPPILVDWNGDGITDVVIISKDGIWGFRVDLKIHHRPHGNLWNRILLGLLFLSLSMAILTHTQQQTPKNKGKRSTDQQT